jgi:hypothetical protein
MYSKIWDPGSGAFSPPGSGIKKLGIRDITSRIHNTALDKHMFLNFSVNSNRNRKYFRVLIRGLDGIV